MNSNSIILPNHILTLDISDQAPVKKEYNLTGLQSLCSGPKQHTEFLISMYGHSTDVSPLHLVESSFTFSRKHWAHMWEHSIIMRDITTVF